MLISTKGRYALRILVDMAEHQTENYITLQEVAQRQDISEKYLESIVRELVKKGIEPSRIYIEGNSKTTRQNLKYSKELMEKENLGDTVVIVTNGWHEFRAYLIAKDLGLSCGTEGAPTPWWLFPANYTRELMAIVYQLLF